MAPAILRALRRRYGHLKVDLQDGVHVEMPDAWFHVRASNTEPVIRLSAEASTREAAERLLADVRAAIEAGL
jgi:phosphomannomutase